MATVNTAYVKLQDLHLTRGNQNALKFNGAHDVSAVNCAMDWASFAGVNVSAGTYNLLMDGGTVNNSGLDGGDGDGIGIGNEGPANHDIDIQDMDIYANGHLALGNNISLGLNTSGTYPYNILINGNTIRNGNFNSSGITLEVGSNVTVQYNLILNNPLNGIYIYSYLTSPPTVSVYVYNNTIVGNGDYGIFAGSVAGTTQITAKNNIIWNTAAGYAEMNYDNTLGGTLTFASDYNNIYNTVASGAVREIDGHASGPVSLATWTANTGYDAHSVSGNPLFTNAGANDFTLQAGSPAIKAGVYIPGVNLMNPPDIGALQKARPSGNALMFSIP